MAKIAKFGWVAAIALMMVPLQGTAVKTASTLSGEPPLVIGHRGASGYLPEHTLAAYELAIEQGADFIEPDLVSTKDGVLIARHEPNMIATTNVAELPQFRDRRRTKTVDGVQEEGFFSEDFTLAEIKQLRARQPRAYRDQSHNDRYEVPTLQEIIDLVKRVEAQTGRKVGIYPETKHPTYFDNLGLSLEEPLIETLVRNQFTDPTRVFIQSFEVSNLKDQLTPLMAANNIDLPLVQLFDEFHLKPYDFVVSGDSRTYGELISRDSLRSFVATYAEGIGPWKRSFVMTAPVDPPVDTNGDGVAETKERLTGEVLPVIPDAHAAGLVVHPYTFRDEESFLTTDYSGDPVAEYKQFYDMGVDGVFTDFPDTAVKARQAR
ncbi:glycerophosphodiester phosphodiesterase [Oscillatoria sp. FACHB-1407]|uniref:glycerophosphodiester phosphodiesterase n=1 Tax=Oscillatoria sp. FACHB-1407 TaxID=2692847 RepID=UPI0016865804|nr:glycerophosphodiester phosphodiesterase [Oscillatoria sp. FACHB-1407]MBD2462145.1 glycerophosphodiester phosphodiesterase [Oscillatoria sp. FACHB-1407]